jgi:hypothetical protein
LAYLRRPRRSTTLTGLAAKLVCAHLSTGATRPGQFSAARSRSASCGSYSECRRRSSSSHAPQDGQLVPVLACTASVELNAGLPCRAQDTSEESGAAAATLLTPLHVHRRPSPLLRQLAALRRRPRECGGHGQEGPHLPLVRAPRNQNAPSTLHARCETALLTATAASSWHPAT